MIATQGYRTFKERSMAAMYRTRLSDLMGKRGLTRMDLVRQAGVSYTTVIKWESKAMTRIDATTEAAFCALLGVTRDELVYIVDEDDDAED